MTRVDYAAAATALCLACALLAGYELALFGIPGLLIAGNARQRRRA